MSSPRPPPEPAAPVSNNRPGFKYKYPEAAPTPAGEDDAEWNKVYTAADSRFYNRNGKSAERSRKFRQSGETYELALVMMAEKKEKLKAGLISAVTGKNIASKTKAVKKPTTVVKKEPSTSSRDVTPGGMGMPLSISEQIKANSRAQKQPSAAPSSKQGTPVPGSSKMGSPPPPAPKLDRPPMKKKGTASIVKKPPRPKGPGTSKSTHKSRVSISLFNTSRLNYFSLSAIYPTNPSDN